MSGTVQRFLAAALAPVLLFGCAPQSASTQQTPAATPQPSAATADTDLSIERILEQMTLREKVGQLFMVRPDALDLSLTQEQIDDEYADGVAQLTDAMRETLKAYPVGGICQFGKNITDPQQIAAFNAELQEASSVPLLIAVDEEGGSVARLANHPAFDLPQYESALAVGTTGNPETARKMGQTIGAYLRRYGFTMDFAPDADVWTNPDNTVIGTRAFSQDADTAALMAGAMAQGLQEEAILPTFKHFPGHGDTAEDSHSGLAYTYQSKEEMQACEFIPFVQPSLGMYAVMVGHIAAPALDASEKPASLSYPVVTELLREELLPDKEILVVTDSLAMGAITAQYTPGEAALQALQAGCDLLLMPESLTEAFEAVEEAVREGTIPEARLDESVARILRFKQQYAGL